MTDKGKAVIEYRSQGGVDISLSPDTVRNFLVQGRKDLVSAQELMFFMNVCRARKLNPFIKDCYLIKFGSDPAAIVTSVDYFRKNARKAPDCKGWKAGIVVLHDGEITYREGSLKLDDETLVGGWAEAKPEGWDEPKRHTINLAGYIKKTKDGKVTRFWQTENQPDMIAKVAESQLLRQLWGEETTGMYSAEEMPTVEDIKSDGPVQSDIKQRIMDGEKKQDEYPPDAKAAHERIEKRIKQRNGKYGDKMTTTDRDMGKAQDPLPDEPAIKPPATENLTDDQVIATEKSFQMLCSTVNVTEAEAYNYINNVKSTTGVELIDIMRTMIEDAKTEFAKMREWLNQGKPAETKGPESAPVKDGRKKKVPLKDLESKSKAWDTENWSRLKSTGFSTYVWKNVTTLASEPEALQKAVRLKWRTLYRDDFPTAGANKLNGNNDDTGMIQAEVYHDPNGNGKTPSVDQDFQQSAPDKEKDPDAFIKWLRGNFKEQLEDAYDYMGLGGRMISGLSTLEKTELIKHVERLIDMDNKD